MALTLDTSRPFRSITELAELVRAISAAPLTESEPDWLEWKREASLGDRRWYAQMAKFIVGFANRDPSVAMRQAGGCAYLVIGSEPGNVNGVSLIDNAILDAGISRFVRASVRWSPQCIQHQGKEILVITVEPPEYGDPIAAMLTSYESPDGNVCRRGDVFIRRHGRTDLATQEDYNMLVQRFAAEGVQANGMRVAPQGAVPAVPVVSGPDEIEVWLSREESVLLVPIRRVMLHPSFERRSRTEYQAEVESYLSEVAPLLPAKARADALVGRAPSMQLSLINETEHNFTAARIEVIIDGNVWAYRSHEDARPEMPVRPHEWGKFEPFLHVSGISLMPRTEFFGPLIDNSVSTRIEFDDVDLRPRTSVQLAPIHLVSDATLAGTTLTATWEATATNANGVARGKIPSHSLC